MAPARTISPALTRHAYWLAVALPLLMPLGFALRELPGMGLAFAWLTPFALYVLLPLADRLIGRDARDPAPSDRSFYTDTLIPVCAAISWFAVLIWTLATLAAMPANLSGWVIAGWTVSLANLGGIIAINVSHELIHRRERWLRNLGGLMLTSVGYACFKLEHPRWHHVKVATFEDPSSAPKGAVVYLRAPRAWLMNTLCAFELAAADARKKGRPAWLNEMTGWYLLTAAMLAAVFLTWGPLPAGVFLAQGLGAALLLEIINFVEHYGLQRQRLENGRFEPPRTWHSWDSDYWLSNVLLIQLPRHADHHVHPTRPYNALQRTAEAPSLPVGYSTAVLLALIPPLWRRVMDNRVPSH